jgi:RND superfamily putative drug exporter
MELLGDANWWLPRWLQRVLPKLSIDQQPTELEPEDEPREAELVRAG